MTSLTRILMASIIALVLGTSLASAAQPSGPAPDRDAIVEWCNDGYRGH